SASGGAGESSGMWFGPRL
uniref:Pyrokinin-5 n=1 Tax=Polyphaga aegyptiaca TaxID=7085 RepID=PPK5_POLAY|nr:RecName: Full=Pyrokinin-5; AltName: Full=FXPRL-amide; AltName: Full=PolAe-Capa-PK [Polyphaga aegyptiaca]